MGIKMTDKILIEGGDVFDGTWEQLADCFGISPDSLECWCSKQNWSYQILRDCPEDYQDSTEEIERLQKNFASTYDEEREKVDAEYNLQLVNMFLAERTIVMNWFKHKFPKRHLKWMSGMGTCCWILDGEILDIPEVDKVKVLDLDRRLDGRTLKVLLPLVNFYRSITDLTHSFQTYPVDIGDCVVSPTVNES